MEVVIVCLKMYKELQENKIVVCLLVGKGITWIISSPNKFHSAKFKDASAHPCHDLCVTNNVKYRYVSVVGLKVKCVYVESKAEPHALIVSEGPCIELFL
jgi:hypothetical protein